VGRWLVVGRLVVKGMGFNYPKNIFLLHKSLKEYLGKIIDGR